MTSLVVMAAVASSCASVRAGGTTPVLGKAHLTGQYGIGWGTPHPTAIYNGGVPSGRAWKLRWTGWGSGSTTAFGLTWLYRPDGGYYAKPGRIELRAFRLGRCTAGGPLAYTRLAVRVAVRPGGALSTWSAWGGWHTLCRLPF